MEGSSSRLPAFPNPCIASCADVSLSLSSQTERDPFASGMKGRHRESQCMECMSRLPRRLKDSKEPRVGSSSFFHCSSGASAREHATWPVPVPSRTRRRKASVTSGLQPSRHGPKGKGNTGTRGHPLRGKPQDQESERPLSPKETTDFSELPTNPPPGRSPCRGGLSAAPLSPGSG